VIVLTIVALVVVGLLLAQAAVSIFLGIVRLAILVTAFACLGFVGLFLWRRGDISGPRV
jgi:hypothetical protein